jgi:hypothetical protein
MPAVAWVYEGSSAGDAEMARHIDGGPEVNAFGIAGLV